MNITIIGLGLIGGSIAAALKQQQPAVTLTAYDKKLAALKYAKQKTLIDHYTNNIGTAISKAEIIIIAVPIHAYTTVLREIGKYITTAQIITDVGSVKNTTIAIARRELKNNIAQFVPGHPIAGSEKAGIANAQSDLFMQRQVILTPTAKTNPRAITKITNLWQSLEATVTIMPPNKHDKILAATSHLPHVISYAYQNIFTRRKNITKYAANSFKDMTRIAKSNPKIWADIFLANSKAVLTEIKKFKQQLVLLETSIHNLNNQKLEKLL
jgi:prephenate dehydrogenase